MTNPAAISTSIAYYAVSKYYFPLKELGLLEEKAHSSSGSGNVQDETRTFCHTGKQTGSQRLLSVMPKGFRH